MQDFAMQEPVEVLAEPEVTVDPASNPARIVVVWRTLERYQADYSTYICSRGLFVITSVTLSRDTPVVIVMVKPDGASVQCGGRVVAPMPTGLGLAVDLDESQLQVLASTAPGA